MSWNLKLSGRRRNAGAELQAQTTGSPKRTARVQSLAAGPPSAAETRKRDAPNLSPQPPLPGAERGGRPRRGAPAHVPPRTPRRTAARGREPVEDPRAEEPGVRHASTSLPTHLHPPQNLRYEVSRRDRK